MWFLQACTLNDPGASNNTPPLTLQAEQNLSLTELIWMPVNVTGFKEYILLQSTNEIPVSPTPVVSANVTVLKRIDDVDVTSFLTSDILFTPRICYKLYVSVDDRFIQSSNVCVDQDYKIFNGFYDRAGHENGLDGIVMFDRVNQHLSLYDYKSEEFVTTENDIVLSFPVIEVSTWQGTTNVFAYDQSPGRLRKYRYPELTSNTYKDFGGVLYAVKSFKDFAIAAVEDFAKGFQVIRKSNLNVVDFETGLSGLRNIAVFGDTSIIALEIGTNSINRYSIDDAGNSTFLESRPEGVSQLSTQQSSAQSRDYFIGGRFGDIVNSNGDIVTSLQSNPNEFIFMTRFNDDETKVVYGINNNIELRLEIVDVTNLPAINRLASYRIPNSNYSDIIIDGNIIYLIGVSFNSGQAETFILKYPMP